MHLLIPMKVAMYILLMPVPKPYEGSNEAHIIQKSGFENKGDFHHCQNSSKILICKTSGLESKI